MKRGLALGLVSALVACGETAPAAPIRPEAPAAATTELAAPAPAAPAVPTAPALPAPDVPAEWPTTLGTMAIDGVHVRDVGTTCGLFEAMPLVQAVGAAVAACASLPETNVVIGLTAGHVSALRTTGPAAACVDAALRTDLSPPLTCALALTFTTAPAE